MAEQVVLFLLGNGYLDDIELKDIKKFETDLIDKIKNDQSDILDDINSSGKLEDETRQKLIQIIESIKKEKNNAKSWWFKKRIKSVKSTQKITKAMKMVAAAKLKKLKIMLKKVARTVKKFKI